MVYTDGWAEQAEQATSEGNCCDARFGAIVSQGRGRSVDLLQLVALSCIVNAAAVIQIYKCDATKIAATATVVVARTFVLRMTTTYGTVPFGAVDRLKNFSTVVVSSLQNRSKFSTRLYIIVAYLALNTTRTERVPTGFRSNMAWQLL